MEVKPEVMAAADSYAAVGNAVSLSKTYSSSDCFFSNAPLAYQPYYFHVMRKCQQFYDGYVPGIHDNSDGIYSTRMAASICGGLANKTVGAEIGFRCGSGEADRKALEYVGHRWSKKVHLQTFCRQAIEYAYALGNSLIKINVASNGDRWVSAVRGDQYVFAEGAMGELTDVKCLVNAYSDTDGKKNDVYMLIEHRFLKNSPKKAKWRNSEGEEFEFEADSQIPYVSFEVVKADVAYGMKLDALYVAQPIKNFDDIPKSVVRAINKDYGSYKLNEPMPMPFPSGNIGAWNLKSNGYDGNVPNMPFGKSILKDIWVELAEYDIYTSFCDKDVNNGQGTVFTPKSMDITDLNPSIGVDQNGMELVSTPREAYRKVVSNIQVLDGVDGEKSKPFVNQFSLRAQEWERLQDNCLRRMAAKLHMSPKVIASFLGKEAVDKTATEIDSEDDTTVDWVRIQRSIFKPCFDELIETVLSSEGINGNVEMRFGSIGSKSRKIMLDEIAIMMEHNLISRTEAMRELFEDKDEIQLNELIDETKKEMEEQRDLFIGG